MKQLMTKYQSLSKLPKFHMFQKSYFFFLNLSQSPEPNTGPVIYYKIMSLTNTDKKKDLGIIGEIYMAETCKESTFSFLPVVSH